MKAKAGADFAKVLETLTEKQTSDLHSRHVALLESTTLNHPLGFRLADLPVVAQILEAAYAKIEAGVDELIAPVCAWTVHCSKPYLRTKSNEEFTNPQLLHSMTRLLGRFLTSFEAQIQVAAAETLLNIATGNCLSNSVRSSSNVDENLDDQRPLPRDYSQQLMEKCGIVPALASALETLVHDQLENEGDDPSSGRMDLLLFPLVDLIQEVSSWGPNAQALTQAGTLAYIIEILDSIHDLRDELLPLCMEILWNVLETCASATCSIQRCVSRSVLIHAFRTTNAIHVMGSPRTFDVLHKLFTQLLLQGHRKQDKELRNMCLMIADILASKRRNIPCFESSQWLHTLLQYATACETGQLSGLAKATNFASASDEDFELKHILWILLSDICTGHEAMVPIVADSALVDVLLMYVAMRPDDARTPVAAQWTPSQRRTLQVLALNVLSNLTALVPERFVAVNGHVVILEFVTAATDPEACAVALLILMQVVTTPTLQQDIGDISGVEAMLALFCNTSHPCSIRRTAITICSQLCAHHEDNQARFRRANGINVLLQSMRFNPSDAVRQDNLIVAIVGCVWSSIIGNPDNEIAFIQSEGVDNLLDLLELAPRIMFGQVLGALAELCVNPKASAYYHAWKSKKHISASQMLLLMYADEEKRLSVARPPTGVISNVHRPLLAHGLDDQTIMAASPETRAVSPPPVAFLRLKQAITHAKGFRNTDPNRRLATATEKIDLRAKIYAVLASVGFSCMADGELSYEEQITLAVAKEFPVFRLGMVWLDVKLALVAHGIRPIYADALLIERHLHEAYAIVQNVRHTQRAIFARREADEATEEDIFLRAMTAHLEAKKRKAEMMRKVSLPGETGASTSFFKDPPPIYHDL
ncbi:hypothetical protein SPRG_19321 [Saprolegnia parasitica CBS 223.65]|uniref:Cilia- and flagella-associated protein 69 ARM repeats domain-containing protein n=1 Tax=Saprolegnia parasitica (strain CBS 223.65) TaxID=695850 RepID=A0A067D4V5_SAPPC|nr:hypothetical protein SPRG_19321 [Saprolegnia parasitica CBS 223.65]KDO33711.1 hypothetical protein SPRG_19321 [Saprolegnia parasitica CBS 223.65]|eukprot:XP_012195732.1 hypothetical protein SPRG_19321 [Saprolegnia parasitica CBS 223.65]